MRLKRLRVRDVTRVHRTALAHQVMLVHQITLVHVGTTNRTPQPQAKIKRVAINLGIKAKGQLQTHVQVEPTVMKNHHAQLRQPRVQAHRKRSLFKSQDQNLA